MTKCNRAVTNHDDLLILVDKEDEIVGYEPKDMCHKGRGILHRAFSIFIFNEMGEFLLQRRSSSKPLWPQFWSNSVCSHPRKGETYEAAASRRLSEEIGLRADLSRLFKFRYQARFGHVGSENEMCVVFSGVSNGPVRADPKEIEEWKFIAIPELDEQLRKQPRTFTPWFKTEWQRFRELDLPPRLLNRG
ncbi:MAG TPA: isopentenyl-diphosphate Delta-isomerase [Syntrophorhabdaceae bacterium]|nr:isopentenyl-diphosphate Delta-isomerase [Syntrophorhabdaceae bacterium]